MKKIMNKITMKKFVFYTVDLEPISVSDCKLLINDNVFNRISTNSIVTFKEVKEINLMNYDDWTDEIIWNQNSTPIKKYDELFREEKSFTEKEIKEAMMKHQNADNMGEYGFMDRYKFRVYKELFGD
jgi:hypothetical protein